MFALEDVFKVFVVQGETDLDIYTTPPEKEEIISAIRSLKNRTAPQPDNLSAGLLKEDPYVSIRRCCRGLCS